MVPIYCISGLGADYRVFKHLEEDFNLIHISWIEPDPQETLKSYCERLISGIEFEDKFYLLGLSFGGIIAQVLNEMINPDKLILVSTYSNNYQPSFLYKALVNCRLNKLFHPVLFAKFGLINNLLFGAYKPEEKKLLQQIILDTSRLFFVWATKEIVSFKSSNLKEDFVVLHGTKDLIIPYKSSEDIHAIVGAGHLAILTHPNDLKTIINEYVIKRSI